MTKPAIAAAQKILDDAGIQFNGQAVGTTAATDPKLSAQNYGECFIRDFVPSALANLMNGNTEIVSNFLTTVMQLRGQQKTMAGHELAEGLMPASFLVTSDKKGRDKIVADFGDRAIGRVAPVDSAMWWMILLRAYTITSGDISLAHSNEFQLGMRLILKLYLRESFETSPAMLVPDGSFMIDRRMGVHGHPLEIQSLFYGMLLSAQELLLPNDENRKLLNTVNKRLQTLRSYVRLYYWLDIQRLNEIHRYKSEEFGWDAVNLLNVYPEIIPDWIDGWLPENTGYLVGNVGPGKIDFRYFSMGNLLAILFGLATDAQAHLIMNLYDKHWEELCGEMPLKIVYPAVAGKEWALMTGNDPKNVAWSYHNGGNWPALIWVFTGAAIRAGRQDLAQRAVSAATERLHRDSWPEYYDGRQGSLIGRRANLNQTWSATSLIIADQLLSNPDSLALFEALNF
ncbi:MAG: glycoside hydrolase 100 family protein [Gammaproteobacteria bacterium]